MLGRVRAAETTALLMTSGGLCDDAPVMPPRLVPARHRSPRLPKPSLPTGYSSYGSAGSYILTVEADEPRECGAYDGAAVMVMLSGTESMAPHSLCQWCTQAYATECLAHFHECHA